MQGGHGLSKECEQSANVHRVLALRPPACRGGQGFDSHYSSQGIHRDIEKVVQSMHGEFHKHNVERICLRKKDVLTLVVANL